MLGLKWDAIDFKRGTLTIKRTLTSVQIDGKTQIIEQDSAKTKSSLRTLPLIGSFSEYFMEVKPLRQKEKTSKPAAYWPFGGELGIRTLGTLLYTTFRVSHLRPLGQLSIYVHLRFLLTPKKFN